MICVKCHKRIRVEFDEFEEVGSIEFAHSGCVDELNEEERPTQGKDWEAIGVPPTNGER